MAELQLSVRLLADGRVLRAAFAEGAVSAQQFGAAVEATAGRLRHAALTAEAEAERIARAVQSTARVDPNVGQFRALEAGLQRQIALFGQAGSAAAMRYDTERGALATLAPTQRLRLVQLATEIDRLHGAERAAATLGQQTRASAGASDRLADGLGVAARAAVALFAVERVVQFTAAVAHLTTETQALARGMAAANGSAAAGAAGMQFSADLAERLGLRLRTTTRGFMEFSAATHGTALEGAQTRDVFEAVSAAAVALGIDSERTSDALRALSQMASKGSVASEELKGQLGEALPGAFGLAAQAMGVTQAKLQGMLDRGEVMASDLLPKLARVLRSQYGQAAQDSARGAAQEWNRWVSAVEGGAAAFGSGWLDDAADVLRSMTGYLKDPEVQSALRDWGEGLGKIIRMIHDNAGDLFRAGIGAGGAYAGGQFGAGVGSAFGPAGTVIGGAAGALAGGALGYQAAGGALGLSPETRKAELEAQLAALQQKGPKSSGMFGITEIDRGEWRAQVRGLEEQIAKLKENTLSWAENDAEVRRHVQTLEAWAQMARAGVRDLERYDSAIQKASQGLATTATARAGYQTAAGELNAAYRPALAEAITAGDTARYQQLFRDYAQANAELTAKLEDSLKAAYARTDRLNSLAMEGTLGAARGRYEAELAGLTAREQALEQQFGKGADAARQRWLALAQEVEARYSLPRGLLGATMHVESGFDPAARSGAGAIGLMQFMPLTARGLGIEPRSPEQSIEGAGRYYRQLLGMFGGDLTSAVAAYNWGPGALRTNGLAAAPAETQAHVQKVLAAIPQYRAANEQLLAVDQDYTQAHADLQRQRQAAESRWIDTQIQALEQQREQRRAAGALTAADEAETNNRITELQQQRLSGERAVTAALTEQYRAAAYARTQVLLGLGDDLARLQAEALPTATARQTALLQLDQQRRRQQTLAQVRGDAQAVAQTQATLDRIDQLEQAAAEQRAHPLRQLAQDWADAAGQMEQASVGWANSTASAIAQFVATGKADFRSLAASIVQDLIRIQLQQQAAPALGWLSSALGSAAGYLFGAPANAGSFSVASLNGPVTAASVHHTGGLAGAGVARAVAPTLFERAPRYHGGGIAGLAPDEVPTILRRGEEVLPRSDPRHRDHAGAASVTVHQPISIDARGADAGAEARIRAALEQVRRQTTADILQSMQRGGTFARAAGRA